MAQVFHIHGSLEIRKNGQLFITERKMDLLRHIHETGSINAASKEMRMSYQQAWNYIKELNSVAPLPVVSRQRGGANGGGAEVTRYGLRLLEEYEKLIDKFADFRAENNANIDLCFF